MTLWPEGGSDSDTVSMDTADVSERENNADKADRRDRSTARTPDKTTPDKTGRPTSSASPSEKPAESPSPTQESSSTPQAAEATEDETTESETAEAEPAEAETAAEAEPTPEAVGERYTTARSGLNVRSGPGGDAEVTTALDHGTEVAITESTEGRWQQIVQDGNARWVDSEYLSETKPPPETVGHRYTTADSGLNVRSGPGAHTEVTTTLDHGTEVAITEATQGPWQQIVRDGNARWVDSEYLSENEPEPEDSADDDGGDGDRDNNGSGEDSGDSSGDSSGDGSGDSGGSDDSSNDDGSGDSSSDDGSDSSGDSGGDVSTEECDDSTSESGWSPDAVRVYRALCNEFPGIDSYLGSPSDRSDGEHGEGRAVDAMISDSALGDEVAEWLRENHEELGVSEVIWAQQIWTVQRSGDGWRDMEDRGSDTANHYDHVHVTVHGDEGSA